MNLPIKIEDISFRKIQDTDLPFLQKVYRSTREQELNQVPWTEQEKSQFVSQQFTAQHEYYREQFPDAWFNIILIHGKVAGHENHVSDTVSEPLFHRAGRLYLEKRETEFRIIDIAFLPEYRGKGWGTKILEAIKDLADECNLGIGIHVEKNNPAMNLYLRLGFLNKEDKGVYQFMMWHPEE